MQVKYFPCGVIISLGSEKSLSGVSFEKIFVMISASATSYTAVKAIPGLLLIARSATGSRQGYIIIELANSGVEYANEFKKPARLSLTCFGSITGF